MLKKNKPNWREIIKDYNDEALFIGEPEDRSHDDAIIGIGGQHGSPCVLIYSYDLLVESFAKKFLSSSRNLSAKERAELQDPWEAAVEWVDTNVASAYLGPHTPIIAYATVDAEHT